MKVSKVAEGIQVREGRRENISKWPLGPFHSQIKSAVCSIAAAAEGIYFSCKLQGHDRQRSKCYKILDMTLTL